LGVVYIGSEPNPYCVLQTGLPTFENREKCQQMGLQAVPNGQWVDGKLQHGNAWFECRHRHVDTWQ
jgi:hypothetical protein